MTERGSRLTSLDVFRGATVAGMILVNNPGNWATVFEPLAHAKWNGVTFADLVFPSFVFILGAAMPFAFARRVAGGGYRALYIRIGRRALWLVALGLLLNLVAAFPDVPAIRIPGVLQRIALAYLIAAPLVIHLRPSGRASAAAAFLLIHWALLSMPIGGHAHGLSETDNLAGLIDRALLGRHTLTPTGDPEGILGTLPTVSTALLGSLAGDWLRRTRRGPVRVGWLVAAGCAAVAVSLVWAPVLPLNKALWTGSFALFTGGIAALALAACDSAFNTDDVRWWAQPFVWLGVNALAIYFLAELCGHLLDAPWGAADAQAMTARSWIFWDALQPVVPGMGEEALSLGFALLTVALWTGVAGLLYRYDVRVQV